MKRMLRIIPLLLALLVVVAGCAGEAEPSGAEDEEVPLERMDRVAVDAEPHRRFDDTATVDTTALDPIGEM